jgi:DNA-directed RNA polymerase specialized sigma subunit
MKAKQYLRKIKWLDDFIKAKLDQVETLRSMATKVTPTLKDVNVQESLPQDKTAVIIHKIIELEEEINDSIDSLVDLKADVIRKIEVIENDEYKLLLTLRYLNFKTWEQIAVDMNFTFQWVHQIHKRALIEFEKLLSSDTVVDSN